MLFTSTTRRTHDDCMTQGRRDKVVKYSIGYECCPATRDVFVLGEGWDGQDRALSTGVKIVKIRLRTITPLLLTIP